MVIQRFLPAIGGAEIQAYELSKILTNMGHNVYVYTTYWDAPNAKKEEIMEGIHVKRFKCLFEFGAYKITPKLFTDLIRSKPDIIHAHTYGFFQSDAALLASHIKKIPSVLTSLLIERETKSSYKRLAGVIYDYTFGRFSIRNASKLIALNKAERKFLIKKFNIKPEKIAIIPPGLNIKKYSNLPEHRELQEKYNLNGPVIIYVGRIAEDKGINYLIDSAKIVKKEYPNSKFLIIGPNMGYKHKLVSKINKTGLNDSIIFTGPLVGNKLLEAYSAADVFVLPSYHEVMPLTILEALAAGIPVITTRLGGISEVISHQVTGFLVKYGDYKKIAEYILRILREPNLKSKLIAAGKKIVNSFSWNNVVKKIISLYNSLI